MDCHLTFSRILAIDLGKFNSVACVYDPATHTHTFTSLQTSPQRVHELLAMPDTVSRRAIVYRTSPPWPGSTLPPCRDATSVPGGAFACR